MTKTTKTIKLLTGTADIEKAISSIKKRGKKLDADIQVAALSAMAHHDQHGDVTLINRLVEAMPKGSRVNALKEYIVRFGKVEYCVHDKVFKHSKDKVFMLEDAMTKDWTDFKPDPEYRPFDAVAELRRLVQRVQNADSEKGDKCTKEQATKLLTLAAELGVEVKA